METAESTYTHPAFAPPPPLLSPPSMTNEEKKFTAAPLLFGHPLLAPPPSVVQTLLPLPGQKTLRQKQKSVKLELREYTQCKCMYAQWHEIAMEKKSLANHCHPMPALSREDVSAAVRVPRASAHLTETWRTRTRFSCEQVLAFPVRTDVLDSCALLSCSSD